MKLIKILFIATAILLFSACSSKDEFYRGTYNWIQNDKFCTNKKECDNKRFYSKEYIQKKKISYDEYKKMIK